MAHLLGLALWAVIVLAQPTPLEQAVTQHPVGPYNWSYRINEHQVISSAISNEQIDAAGGDWQALYDETWRRIDDQMTFTHAVPETPLYEPGCWDAHTCPPILIAKVGEAHREVQEESFFFYLLRLFSSLTW